MNDLRGLLVFFFLRNFIRIRSYRDMLMYPEIKKKKSKLAISIWLIDWLIVFIVCILLMIQ